MRATPVLVFGSTLSFILLDMSSNPSTESRENLSLREYKEKERKATCHLFWAGIFPAIPYTPGFPRGIEFA